MLPATNEELESRIVDLWGRRHNLSADEWNEFGRLVLMYLRGRNFSHYSTLHRCFPFEDMGSLKRQLIEDFFTDKVFLPSVSDGFKASELVSAKALANTYYTNYLNDRIRRCKEHDPPEPTEPPQPGKPEPVPLAICDELTESYPEIHAAAVSFLSKAEPCDWLMLFLGCHQCVEHEDRPALSWLAKKHQIPSYARRAKDLGITRPHGGYTTEAPWASTRLGVWIQELGIEVSELTEPGQNRTRRVDERIGNAFKILCCEALKRVKDDNCC